MLTGLLVLMATADAEPVFKRPAKVGYNLGISVLVNLGPAEDRKRAGVALDAAYQRFWHHGAYRNTDPNQVGPLVRVATQVGWTQPFVHSQLTLQGGAMYPAEVGDGGYLPFLGGLVGGGLGMSTDGSAGPLLTSTLVGPILEGRLEATRWDGGWHAPRLSIGPQLPMNCCAYYY